MRVEDCPSRLSGPLFLYSAGKRLGRDGAVYLDRIPDDDFRLFAQIEFLAAVGPDFDSAVVHTCARAFCMHAHVQMPR